MEETLIWVAGLVVEILLVVTVVFAVLLRRSRKAQHLLLAQLANHGKHDAEGLVAVELSEEVEAASAAIEAPSVEASTVDAPAVEPSGNEADPPTVTSTSFSDEIDQLLASIDGAQLDETVDRLQQQLEASTQSLQRLAAELQQESPSTEQGRVEAASLQTSLQEMTTDFDSLKQSNAHLQQDLRSKTKILQQTASNARENTQVVMQHTKKLRSEISVLRDKIKHSEGDVQRLQSEKDALATEFAALNKEYERIYSSFRKS